MAIVTKQSLAAMLQDEVKREHVIGRALVRLLERQTRNEQAANVTNDHNHCGFNSADAKSGSITAKYYIKHKKLESWMVERWMKPSHGYPRICRYSRQLNEIAIEVAAQKANKE